MLTWTGVWSATEAEAYLAERTVPIRIACRMAAGGLWMLSLWYLYDGKKEEFYRRNRPSASGLDPEGEGRTLG